MFDRAKQLFELKKKAGAIQKELKNTEIEARGGGGKIRVIMTGEQKLKEISVDESLLNPSNKVEFEKMLLETISEAIKRSQAYAAEKTKKLMGDLGVNLPGM